MAFSLIRSPSDFNCIFDSIPLGNPPYLLVSHLPVCFLKADIVTFILFPIRWNPVFLPKSVVYAGKLGLDTLYWQKLRLNWS